VSRSRTFGDRREPPDAAFQRIRLEVGVDDEVASSTWNVPT